MNFSTFPTDSLHKFFAIAGLFLVVFNIYYSSEEMYKVQEQRLNIIDQMEDHLNQIQKMDVVSKEELELNLELNGVYTRLTTHLTNLETELKKYEQQPNRANTIKALMMYDSIDYFTSLRDSTHKKLARVEKRMKKMRQDEDSVRKILDRKQKRFDLAEEKYNFFREILFYGSIIGSIMAGIGFYYWIQTQHRMDSILFRRPLNVSHYRRPKSLKSFFKKK